MSLTRFFQIPLIKVLIHAVILGGFIANIWQLQRVRNIEEKITREQHVLTILQQENNDARNQRDYFTSDLYKEKYLKQEGFAVRGEQVIDTSVLEPTADSSVGNYIPPTAREPRSNLEKWRMYLFGDNRSL